MLQITPQMRVLVALEAVEEGRALTPWFSYAARNSLPILSLDVCSSFEAGGPLPFACSPMTARAFG